jgi:hypothetical protein
MDSQCSQFVVLRACIGVGGAALLVISGEAVMPCDIALVDLDCSRNGGPRQRHERQPVDHLCFRTSTANGRCFLQFMDASICWYHTH